MALAPEAFPVIIDGVARFQGWHLACVRARQGGLDNNGRYDIESAIKPLPGNGRAISWMSYYWSDGQQPVGLCRSAEMLCAG